MIYKIFCNDTVIEELMRSTRKNKSVFEEKKFFLKKMQEENDKVLFEKMIIKRSVSLLRQHHIITFEQYYLLNI